MTTCCHSFLQQHNATFSGFNRLFTRNHSSSDLYSLAMKQVTDYYAVLGVDANAPTEVIKKAFQNLVLQYHPDIYKGEDAQERMREILLAYQTLIEPEHHRTYELSRPEHMPGSFVPPEKNTDVSPTARHDRQRYYAFPVLNEGVPAQTHGRRRNIGCCPAPHPPPCCLW